MHARKQIREKVKEILGLIPTFAGRVKTSKVYAHSKEKLPSISIYTKSEDVENGSMGKPASQKRVCKLVIVGVCKDSNDIDSALDDIATLIENAMGNSLDFGGLVSNCSLDSTDSDYFEGEQSLGFIELSYLVDYQVMENDVEVIL